MILSETAKSELISKPLQSLLNNPEHRLNPTVRKSMYDYLVQLNPIASKTDQPKNGEELYFGDHLYGHLSILTGYYVLPVWNDVEFNRNHFYDEDYEPYNWTLLALQIAYKVLRREISPSKASEMLNNDLFEAIGSVGYDVKYNVFCASMTAISSLSAALLGLSVVTSKKIDTQSDDISFGIFDFASWAVKAFTANDENEPGRWLILNNQDKLKTIKFSKQKRLEFWEWWLTEAIPQAWELAEQSSSPNNG